MPLFKKLSFVLLVLLGLSACQQLGIGLTTIADLQKDSAAYEGKEVAIRGVADQSIKIPLIGTRLYRLKDSQGEIMVISSGTLPADGEELIVRGRIQNALIMDNQGYGLTLQEQERETVWIKK